MNCTTTIQGPKAIIKLAGRFTFEHHAEFKAATKQALEAPGVKEIDLDFSDISYMDSSALGMLLLLREKSEAKTIAVSLLKPNASVMAILKVVNFGKLFQIVS